MSRGVLEAPIAVARPRPLVLPAWLSEAAGPLLAVALVLLRDLELLRGRILVDYDVFVYFYPLHEYAARRLARGELPLWNPHAFFGTPLLANPQVAIKTSVGTMTVELYADKAPKTVENFLTYVKANFYNGTIFHRVIPGFMIQGGGFTQEMEQKQTQILSRLLDAQRPMERHDPSPDSLRHPRRHLVPG